MSENQNENINSQGFQANNYGFNSAGALQIRLNVKEDVVDQFEVYLRGKDYRMVELEDGSVQRIETRIGDPLVNEQGYQAVMSWISGMISSQTVQANFVKEDDFRAFMLNYSLSIIQDLYSNRKHYGIDISKIEGLVNKMELTTHLILTRPLFNKERDGMNNTMKISETMQSQQTSKGWFGGLPFMGGKK
jgi:hypothetical protein